MKTTIQQLNLQLISSTVFNAFDGRRVVKDLLQNRDLWTGVVLDRLGSLIKLRDISSDTWNVDTLFILASNKDNKALEAIARKWEADEVDWVEQKEAERLLGSWNGGKHNILRLWWD